MARRHTTEDDDVFDEDEDSRERADYRSAFDEYGSGGQDEALSQGSDAGAYIAASNAEYERLQDEERVREEERQRHDSDDDDSDDDDSSAPPRRHRPETFAATCDHEARMRVDQWHQDSLRAAQEMMAKNPPPPPPKKPSFFEWFWQSLFG